MIKAEKRVIRAAIRWHTAVLKWESNNFPTEYEEDKLHEAEYRVLEACAALAARKRRKP
jgi:hypothetical protein